MAQPLLIRWRFAIVNDPRLSAADRHVALTLALHMDKHGAGAYPSIRLLAAECKRKAHTVIASIQTLEELDYLEVVRGAKVGKRGWTKDVNRYTAQLPQRASGAVAPSGRRQLPQGAHKLYKSSDGGRLGGAAAICEECEVGGGHHANDCTKAKAAAA